MSVSSFPNFPNLVIEKILEKSDWKSVLTLRQVNHHLRNFIDNDPESSLPDSNLTEIQIFVKFHSIELQFTDFLGMEDRISYGIGSGDKFSRILNSGNKKNFENEDLMNQFLKDVGKILKFQKSKFQNFKVRFYPIPVNSKLQNFSVLMRNFFLENPRKIQTEKLEILTFKSSQIMDTLSFLDLDQNSLKNIFWIRSCHKPDDFKLEDFMDTVGKGVEEVLIENYCTPPMEYLNYGSRSSTHFQEFSALDLDYLRKTYSTSKSSCFLSFTFRSLTLDENENLFTLWGPRIIDDRDIENWYFRTSDIMDILQVSHEDQDFSCLKFRRVQMEHVLNGAVIEDV